jgi:hypothetical protein
MTEVQFEKREIVGLRTNGTSRIWPNSLSKHSYRVFSRI